MENKKKIIAWSLQVVWDDDSNEIIYDIPTHIAQDIDEFLNSCLITDFVIENYQSHGVIKAPLSN
jgi:hypothetical protein